MLRLFPLLLSLCAACSALEPDRPQIPPSEAFDAESGAWNPDGTQIAFIHSDEGGPNPAEYDQLWIYDLATQERRLLLPGRILAPDWSPDGKWFTFHSFTDPEFLFRANLETRKVTPLTGAGSPNPTHRYTHAGRWSPDGKWLLYSIVAGEPRGIVVARADGTDAQIVAPYGIVGSWHPSEARILYVNWDMAQPDGRRRQIFTARPDGSEVAKLTDLPDSDIISAPAYSPDGSQIAFSHWGDTGSSQLYLMNADGTHIRQVTRVPGSAFSPRWSPDGKQILFSQIVWNVSRRLYLLDPETLKVSPLFPLQ